MPPVWISPFNGFLSPIPGKRLTWLIAPPSRYVRTVLILPLLLLTLLGHPQAMGEPFVRFNIESARQQLFKQYWQKQITFDEMLSNARSIHNQNREPFLAALKVKDAGYHRKPDEIDIPVRSGSSPGTPAGRGIFSDEDIECETAACLQLVKHYAEQFNYPIEEKPLHLYIRELDLKIWKPRQAPPNLSDQWAYHTYALTLVQDEEYAWGARYGTHERPMPMEVVLENLTKGYVGFTRKPDQWGNGYHRYEELIQLAKNTVRSLESTGLCDTLDNICQTLQDFRKMRTSPESLGWFSPGMPDTDFQKQLYQRQQEMIGLMGQAFEKAQEQMNRDIKALEQQLCYANNLTPETPLYAKAKSLQESLYRIAVRYDLLANRYPELMQRLATRNEFPLQFATRQMNAIARIESRLMQKTAAMQPNVSQQNVSKQSQKR